MKYETLQTIQTRLVQYFVTNVRNTNLLGVNSKDLSESFCLMVTKFFFTTSLSSLIWYVFMFLSLRSVANWRSVMVLTVFMVGTDGDSSEWHAWYVGGWLTAMAHMVCGSVTHCNGMSGMRGMRACVTHRNGMLEMSRMLELTRFF